MAEALNDADYATLLIDFLTPEEQEIDATSGELCANIELMTERLLATFDWVRGDPVAGRLSLGLFGAGTGAAVGVAAAVASPGVVRAMVSRGGSLELVSDRLPKFQSPMLLIVAGERGAGGCQQQRGGGPADG